MTIRSLSILTASLAVLACSCASSGELAQVGDYRITAFNGGGAEVQTRSQQRTQDHEQEQSQQQGKVQTVAATRTLAASRSDFVVRTTAYTHTEADSLQYGTKNAYGTELKFGDVRSAAADWSRYPVGTVFKIKGLPYSYVVDDYGSALVGTDTIDLYKPSKAEMNAWGAREVGIEVLQWGSFAKSMEILNGRKGKANHVDKMLGDIKGKINTVPSELRNGFRPS